MVQNTIAAFCLLVGFASVGSAQIIESVGNRALGMGGAFVAVASDSTATWWNPAGLATGPFADVSLARANTDLKVSVPARRDQVSWFAASAPAIGFSYYRLRITDIRGFGPTGQDTVDRQDTRAEVSSRSISVSELGVTLVQSIRDAAASVNPEIMVLCHGGPLAEPDDVAYVLSKTHGIAGFFGASSVERLPAERAITDQVQRFKSIPLQR